MDCLCCFSLVYFITYSVIYSFIPVLQHNYFDLSLQLYFFVSYFFPVIIVWLRELIS